MHPVVLLVYFRAQNLQNPCFLRQALLAPQLKRRYHSSNSVVGLLLLADWDASACPPVNMLSLCPGAYGARPAQRTEQHWHPRISIRNFTRRRLRSHYLSRTTNVQDVLPDALRKGVVDYASTYDDDETEDDDPATPRSGSTATVSSATYEVRPPNKINKVH